MAHSNFKLHMYVHESNVPIHLTKRKTIFSFGTSVLRRTRSGWLSTVSRMQTLEIGHSSPRVVAHNRPAIGLQRASKQTCKHARTSTASALTGKVPEERTTRLARAELSNVCNTSLPEKLADMHDERYHTT